MLRSIARFSLLKRFVATKIAPKPEVTDLSNGITVVTEKNKQSQVSSIGFVFGSGSCGENPYNNGVSYLFSNNFKTAYAGEANKKGYILESAVDREYQSYVVSGLSLDVIKVFDFLQSKLLFPLKDNDFQVAKNDTIKKVVAFEEYDHAGRVMEHLHATAFQNTSLSLPKRGTIESLKSLEKSDVQDFLKHHFVSSNVVVVGTGNVSHKELVDAVQSNVSLPSRSKPTNKKVSTFLGSEIRLRDDTLPKAWISIAAEGEPIKSPNYYVAQVAAEIFGSYSSFEPTSNLQGVRLLDSVKECNLADSFDHYSLSYKDSGLWGFSAVISNLGQIDDMVHFTLKEWNRLTISITDTEVKRGKALLKSKLAATADNNAAATLLGASTLTRGIKPSNSEIISNIDAITTKDIKNWASEKLWDQDVAVCGTGQIEGLLDYMRIRNDMSMMRW